MDAKYYSGFTGYEYQNIKRIKHTSNRIVSLLDAPKLCEYCVEATCVPVDQVSGLTKMSRTSIACVAVDCCYQSACWVSDSQMES